MMKFMFKKKNAKGYKEEVIESEYLPDITIYYNYTNCSNRTTRQLMIDTVVFALYTYYRIPRFIAWFEHENEDGFDLIVHNDIVEFENNYNLDKMRITTGNFQILSAGEKEWCVYV